MAQPVDSIPAGISDGPGAPAPTRITANSRVRATTGPIGIITDVPTFPPPTATGVWTVGTVRCRINGQPVVTATAVGIGIAATAPVPPSTGPLRLTLSDSRVRAS